MKLFTSAAVGAVSVLAMMATATSAFAMNDVTPQEKALIEAAKKEGSVTVLHSIFADRTSQNFVEGFKKRYGLGDEFTPKFLRKGTGATVAQARQEIQAGKLTFDILINASPAFFDQVADRDGFLELDSGQWKDTEGFVKSAAQYARYPYVVTPFAYAFQPVWNASCPGMENIKVESYKDVMNPALKGKIIMSDLTKSTSYPNTVIALQRSGALKLEELWAGVKELDPLLEFRTEAKMQLLISCERPFDIWNIPGRVYQNVLAQPDLKDKIKFSTYKEGMVMLGTQVAVVKGASNPNAAKLFVEYLLSKEGADVYVEGEALFSFRANYTPPEAAAPYLFDLTKVKLIGMDDWVEGGKDVKPVRDVWQTYFQ